MWKLFKYFTTPWKHDVTTFMGNFNDIFDSAEQFYKYDSDKYEYFEVVSTSLVQDNRFNKNDIYIMYVTFRYK